ncbi:hypothetical protein AVEN_148237-1 [Araneus ventricosus]|uniref:Transmembrane protein n=1 Tax=Araneus ventricosus TaxID=182803 RepID=A0A4Y2IEV8_ARAVE|nr:hypothetical protein AVEN_148237-1 [Araneus ventricosus]
MHNAFCPPNAHPAAVRVRTERRQNDQSAAASLLQNLQHSVHRSFELGRLTSVELERFSAERGTREKIELVVWFFGLIVTVSAVVMGSCYINHCPALWLLPYHIIITGVAGIAFMLCALYEIGVRISYGSSGRIIMKILLWTFTLLLILEPFHYLKSVSSDAESAEYCNKVFYDYSITFSVLTIQLLVIGWGRMYFLQYTPARPRNAIELEATAV